MTKLVEFKNHKGEILRALFDKAKSKRGIIFVHGFERTTVESKFKNIIDNLKGRVNLFRFDFSGCGLSDGKFEDLTVNKLIAELTVAERNFKKISGAEKISFVAHSLGCVVVLIYLTTSSKTFVDKVIFLAPALNQKNLQRFWYAKSLIPDQLISWPNLRKYTEEKRFEQKFQEFIFQLTRMTKEHFISAKYFTESSNFDYQDYWRGVTPDLLPKFMIIHGDTDDKVPIQSNDKLPAKIKKIIVSGGDHDLQRPDMVKQYLSKVVHFLLKD